LKIWQTGCPETLVTNHQGMLHSVQGKRRHIGSLKFVLTQDFLTMKILETASPATQLYIPQDLDLQQHDCESIKSCIFEIVNLGNGFESHTKQ
jgi:hypothetical protein